MSEQLRSEPPAPSRWLADRADPEAFVRTVSLEELLSTLRRHVWLVLGVAAVAVAATGFVAYTTGPVYRAVAVIRLSDPRRALTGGVVEDPGPSADERFADPLLSQVELLTSGTVAGAVVDSVPMLRVLTRKFSPSLLGGVAVAPDSAAHSFQLTFGRDDFVVEGPAGQQRRAAYGRVVDLGVIRFAVLHRPSAKQGFLQVLDQESAISYLIAKVRVRPRLRTDIVDVAGLIDIDDHVAPASLRQRTAGHGRPSVSSTVVHSQVARPSGPLKLQVISKTPGAFTTAFTRRLAGHDAGSLVSTNRSQAALKARAAARNISRSSSDSRW